MPTQPVVDNSFVSSYSTPAIFPLSHVPAAAQMNNSSFAIPRAQPALHHTGLGFPGQQIPPDAPDFEKLDVMLASGYPYDTSIKTPSYRAPSELTSGNRNLLVSCLCMLILCRLRLDALWWNYYYSVSNVTVSNF